MPHVTLEYSGNLSARIDFSALCGLVHGAMLDSGLFELGAVRVRALRSEHCAIADQLPENAFIDVSVRIGAGRTAEEKQRLGEALFAAMAGSLGALFETPHFALSLEIRDIDPVLSWKKNAMHARLRGT